MTTADTPPANVGRPKRADARRNEQALLDAAAVVFVRAGVDAPVRDIAAEAGVGMGTIYRHFPTRADLVVAVFRHQLDALAAAESITPAAGETPYVALRSWVARFADFLVTKHVIPAMIENGGGAIIITITTNAFMNYRHVQAYGTTKAALIQLTKSLAMDYAEKNVRVNALAPGEVLTPMWERHFNALPNPAEAKEAVRRKIPIGRIATPEEVASCALFLASDDSKYVTGNVIFVDGGLMAGFYDATL